MSQVVPPSSPSTNQRPSQLGAPPVPVLPPVLLVAVLGDVLHAKKAKPIQAVKKRPIVRGRMAFSITGGSRSWTD
jgi:hypothetical protein